MGGTILDATDAESRQGAIQAAAAVLREGGLVAFPTETVYGLGAVASNEPAVRCIFEAKGRPSGVPLIVHVTDVDMARRYAASLPEVARKLAEEFWPGPLTFVLPRAQSVPRAVTGGGETVAVRAPAHAAALALIREVGEGIAAPSANRYNDLPPVRGEHVVRGLGAAVDCVLDAGRCPGGLESTVLDLTQTPARVLRRGAISTDRLREHLEVVDAVQVKQPARTTRGAWLSVVEVGALEASLAGGSAGPVGLVLRTASETLSTESVLARRLASDMQGYAAELYDVLHEFRTAGCVRVVVEAIPDGPEWDAVADRLVRLSEGLAADVSSSVG